MNGKYYGKREIRWHSREKDRLDHIHKRKDKNESVRGNRSDLGHCSGIGSGNVSVKLLAGTSHRAFGRS